MIRLLTLTDAPHYQALKLQSLKSDPLAFLSSYEREKNYPLSYYQQKIHYTTLPPIFGIYGLFSTISHEFTPYPDVKSGFTGPQATSQLIGITQLSQEYHLKKHHLANIYDVYIDPNFRHIGHAKKLLTHLIEAAKTYPPLEELQLWCNSRNDKAIKLYQSLSFTLAATRHHAVKEPDGTYQDELHFSLALIPHHNSAPI